ncbi:hypothetical protein MCOR07_008891 [Pyricularia oryzae]|uniref:Uncharacterized protein n=1 Tax=Pyricularia grisea TaxID=148305 RepID=A0ABQ8NA67_PYRGI|nr:hypothetical protein MCOR01_004353 [Pyricularia oryzae]KAI6292912.1 hypothetical protein MCOR33_009523 [Pyricularia grisea]KAI6263546.1 hypothetical protein MCOR19_000182 [Pyricularia oryzae]KAI6283830.1 hypothetical protein MCOR26_002235 [Pyricularia oryzae]KAI6308772.1 hypothetical protein MCOR29_009192 [Pyricularia oryzae]
MERPQTLANLWLIVRTIGWLVALEGVADFFSDRHYHTVIRRLILLFLDHDPAIPRPPEDWVEWYNS